MQISLVSDVNALNPYTKFIIIRFISIVAKVAVSFMYVPPSLYISAAPTGQIFMKFYKGDLYENLSRKPRFG